MSTPFQAARERFVDRAPIHETKGKPCGPLTAEDPEHYGKQSPAGKLYCCACGSLVDVTDDVRQQAVDADAAFEAALTKGPRS